MLGYIVIEVFSNMTSKIRDQRDTLLLLKRKILYVLKLYSSFLKNN